MDNETREKGKQDIAWGIGLIVVFGGISLLTYAAAEPGGMFLVLWGPALYGGFRLIRGLGRLSG